MTDTIKNCGNCKWWIKLSWGENLGECNCPLPSSIDAFGIKDMRDTDGTDCPIFTRKKDEALINS